MNISKVLLILLPFSDSATNWPI